MSTPSSYRVRFVLSAFTALVAGVAWVHAAGAAPARTSEPQRVPETSAPSPTGWKADLQNLEQKLRGLRDKLHTQLEPLQAQIKSIRDELDPQIQQLQDQVKSMVEQHKSPELQQLDREEDAELAALADREKAETDKVKERFSAERKEIQQKFDEKRKEVRSAMK